MSNTEQEFKKQQPLNRSDIQGNVLRAYGKYGYPFARYFFFNIATDVQVDEEKRRAARNFVESVRHEVTTASPWPKVEGDNGKTVTVGPKSTMNIAFTFFGLLKLGLPYRTIQGFPYEFTEGMRARAHILGDRDQTITGKLAEEREWDKNWDEIWRNNRRNNSLDNSVDIWVSVNAQLNPNTMEPVSQLQEMTQKLQSWADDSGCMRMLSGHGDGVKEPYQEANAVFEKYQNGEKSEIFSPSPKEHFGFTDGIGDPVFEGQFPDARMEKKVIGRGKLMPREKGGKPEWLPLATGEFLLGHPDESQELPPTSVPIDFMRNGTFMAYRKLHQNVKSFHNVVEEEAKSYAKIMDIEVLEAIETLYAKMCGRWRDGVPLSVVPTYDEWVEFGVKNNLHPEDKNALDTVENLTAQIDYIRSPEASNFRFGDDSMGFKCPVGAHLRRVNTRDYLSPRNKFGADQRGEQYENPKANAALNKRRRILRRGLPYGKPMADNVTDDTQQGVIMLIMGASISRQFEFVQQQWIQYGLDFNQGNNTCPLLGDHDLHKRFTITSDPKSGKPPYVMSKLKSFVECRGGDYFFIPSMSALRMIATGTVDPT